MKLSEVDLQRTIDNAAALVGLTDDYDDLWRHRNGSVYTVVMVALREEDCTPLVVYKGEYGGPPFARPLPEFLDGRYTREAR